MLGLFVCTFVFILPFSTRYLISFKKILNLFPLFHPQLFCYLHRKHFNLSLQLVFNTFLVHRIVLCIFHCYFHCSIFTSTYLTSSQVVELKSLSFHITDTNIFLVHATTNTLLRLHWISIELHALREYYNCMPRVYANHWEIVSTRRVEKVLKCIMRGSCTI